MDKTSIKQFLVASLIFKVSLTYFDTKSIDKFKPFKCPKYEVQLELKPKFGKIELKACPANMYKLDELKPWMPVRYPIN